MNFQMALGQVASRMNDPAARYAIAFPMTADHVKVLRTFRGSLAFEQLGVAFHVVNRSVRWARSSRASSETGSTR